MRGTLAVGVLLALVPPALAGAFPVTHQIVGAGLGKSYEPVDCYAPAAMGVVVDEAARTVAAWTVDPCGIAPLGAAYFEHTFTFDQCDPRYVPPMVHCEALDGSLRTSVWVTRGLAGGVFALGYAVTTPDFRFAETLASGVALP